MKKYFFMVIILFASGFVLSQEKTEPAGTIFPKGYTKTTTVSTDQSLNKVVTVEVKDEAGIVRQRTTWKKDLENNWTIEQEDFKPSGKSSCKTTIKTIKIEGKDRINQMSGNDKTFYRTPEGELKQRGADGKLEADQVKTFEQTIFIEILEIEKNVLPSLEPKKSACVELEAGCPTQFAAFAGPSVLIGDVGSGSETFVGGHISFSYNINQKVGIGLDASFHTKKFDTESLNRTFVMLQGTYTFTKPVDCERPRISIFSRIAIGMMSEKYGNSDGSTGLAYGGGVGLNYNVNKKLAIRLFQADYLLSVFDSETLGNFRASTGLVLKFGG